MPDFQFPADLGGLVAARDYVAAQVETIHRDNAGEALSPEDQTRYDEGREYVRQANALVERHNEVSRLADNPAARDVPALTPPQVTRTDGDPYDLSTLSMRAGRTELRGRALTAIEGTRHMTDDQRAATVALLERHETPQGALSRHILATGSEAYRSGFQKMVSGNEALLTNEERAAVQEARALSLTDAEGGFAVPFTLDPTIISTRAVSTNPFRRISSIKTTVTERWSGVSSGGMTVSWDGEAAQVSDDSPTLAQPSIRVHKAQGFAVGSIEVSQDWVGIEADLRDMIQEGKDDAEAIVFTIGAGDGSNEPTGIITALSGTSSEVAPTTAETFALADIYKVENALPGKYRLATLDGDTTSSRASWLADRPTYNSSRQFDTAGGAGLWTQLGGGLPERLLGHPAYEATAMRSTSDINAAATATNNFILLLGDFRFFHIVDRVGLSVEYIPHIFGADGRPTGQRGWYCYWRVGSDSVNDDAFRVLAVDTAA